MLVGVLLKKVTYFTPIIIPMEVRRRAPYTCEEEKKETFVEQIKKVDTFEKLPQQCINYTSSGGGGIWNAY